MLVRFELTICDVEDWVPLFYIQVTKHVIEGKTTTAIIQLIHRDSSKTSQNRHNLY